MPMMNIVRTTKLPNSLVTITDKVYQSHLAYRDPSRKIVYEKYTHTGFDDLVISNSHPDEQGYVKIGILEQLKNTPGLITYGVNDDFVEVLRYHTPVNIDGEHANAE